MQTVRTQCNRDSFRSLNENLSVIYSGKVVFGGEATIEASDMTKASADVKVMADATIEASASTMTTVRKGARLTFGKAVNFAAGAAVNVDTSSKVVLTSGSKLAVMGSANAQGFVCFFFDFWSVSIEDFFQIRSVVAATIKGAGNVVIGAGSTVDLAASAVLTTSATTNIEAGD
jgi:hypothetical protein